MALKTKICGIKTQEAADIAIAEGAAYLGFIFFPRSPRHITAERAASIKAPNIRKVAVWVNPQEAELETMLRDFAPDYLQLHGDETPERVALLKQRFGLPIIKAIKVSTKADIAQARAYEEFADMLLFDAKPPADATLPGGNGLSFDWMLLQGHSSSLPWFLSGGLNVDNIESAVAASHAPMVDISSGIERAPGVKDAELLRAFLRKAATL